MPPTTGPTWYSPLGDQPPVATNLSAAESYTEGTPLNLIDIVVSDADSANVTATLTLSNPAAGSLSTATAGAVTSTYIAGTGVWTASGAIADVNALLAGVTFTPTANFNGSFSVATSVSDGVAPAITGTKAFAPAGGTTLTGSSGSDTIPISATQWAGFSTIDLGSGTDILNVVASGDISLLATPVVSNVELGNLTGTVSGDSMTLTGVQLDAIIIGGGVIDLGAGADAINITSTSADLNALGATDTSI